MSDLSLDGTLEKIDLVQDKQDFIECLNILNDFGNQFYDREEYDKCAIIDFKIVCSASRILGLENPDTLKAMENLAVDYRKLGKKEQAVSTYEDLIKYRKRTGDGRDKDTIRCMVELAGLYEEMKNEASFNKILEELASLCSYESNHVVS